MFSLIMVTFEFLTTELEILKPDYWLFMWGEISNLIKNLLTEDRCLFLIWQPFEHVLQASQIRLVQLEFHQQPNAFRKDLAGCIELCYHLLYQSHIFWHRCWLLVICLELKDVLRGRPIFVDGFMSSASHHTIW